MKCKDYCPRCGGDLIARKGRYGDFFGCSNYPKCKFLTGARAWRKTVSSSFREDVVYPGSFESNTK